MKKRLKPRIIPILSKVKRILKGIYGSRMRDVILYGSYARGTPTKDSDIDIAVVLGGRVDKNKESDRITDALYPLSLETGELISVNPISEKEMKNRVWPLYHHIRTEGIRL
ncbi:MAG: nucleotidyltransferase domain-containing protein [Candidatus Altiarchaeota archaeon]|nr:nucleotidyltransferase domain-containing protein [Candidatus Altiarchaeota archaeon]